MKIKDRLLAFGTRKQSSILSASIVLGVTFGLSAILGFLRSRFLYAQFFGCCVLELDAYNAAFRLPDLIFKLLVTGSLSASFIPVFSSYLHRDEKMASKIASTVINLLLIVFIFLALIVAIYAPFFNSLIAAGFSGSQLELMTNLTRILLVAQIFFLISNFITSILQVNQIFIIPSLSPIVYNFFIILSIFTLAPSLGIYGVAYGAVVGALFHLLIQLPAIRHVGFKYTVSLNTQLAGVKEVVRLMIPRTLSLGLGEIENTITLFFASTLSAGSISLLNLAMQIMYLPSRIFGTTVGQASLPILSKNIARNELDEFRNTVRRTILQSLFIALPFTCLILIHRVSIIRLAFGAKEFPWSATLLTAKTLAYLTPAIAAQAVIQILVRSFYAMHNTKTPLRISALSLVVNISSAFIFVNYTNLGILGLAISASLGNLTQCFGLLTQFIRTVDGSGWTDTFWHFIKIFIASLSLSIASWVSLRFFDVFILDSSKTINLFIIFSVSSIIGIITYILVSTAMRVGEINDYKRYLARFRSSFISK